MNISGGFPFSSGPDGVVRAGIRTRLSIPLATVAAGSFGAGIVSGGISFLDRSPHRAQHGAGTAAWPPHLALLALAVTVTALVMRRNAAPAGLLLAPIGSRAAHRLGRTLSSAGRHPTAALRLLIGILPMAILLYVPWRFGVQILGGLDPNFTANAWGGPSYLGAMACHYLDGALLLAVSAGLLNRILLPAEEREQRHSHT